MPFYRRASFREAIKWVVYGLILLLAYCLQTTKGLTVPIFGVRPLLMVGVVICVAFFEQEVGACVFAFFAGLLMDYACNTLLGYFALFFVLTSLAISFLTHFLALPNFTTFLAVSSVSLVLLCHADFFFRFVLTEEEGLVPYYLHTFLPTWLYTGLTILLFYFLLRFVFLRLQPQNEAEMTAI